STAGSAGTWGPSHPLVPPAGTRHRSLGCLAQPTPSGPATYTTDCCLRCLHTFPLVGRPPTATGAERAEPPRKPQRQGFRMTSVNGGGNGQPAHGVEGNGLGPAHEAFVAEWRDKAYGCFSSG